MATNGGEFCVRAGSVGCINFDLIRRCVDECVDEFVTVGLTLLLFELDTHIDCFGIKG